MAEELIKKILVPIDGSPASQNALDYAGWVAGKTGASITLLHVIDADKFKTNFEAMDRFQPEWKDKIKRTDDIKRFSPFFEEQLSCMLEDPVCKRGDNLLKEMAKYAEKYKVKPKTMMKLGRVIDTIVQVAEDEKCDQIIVGKTGLTGIKRMMMGHVAEDVSRYAHCRVTVVP
jgi:nucleotide-binding universal stress UspA family protein